MAHYTYLQPTDQPTGVFRLLDWLEANFCNDDYQDFRCLVAFAKIKPFYKLHPSLQLWNSKGKSSEAVIGIDHKGTSFQALQYALANFDCVNILHVNYSTFHPKLYIFSGQTKATSYYGSSNFTSGGLETNFEGGIIIDFTFPTDQNEFDKFFKSYSSVATLSGSCITKLTPSFLNILNGHGLLLDETKTVKTPHSSTPANTSSNTAASSLPLFGGIHVKPARSIPKNVMVSAASSAGILLTSPQKGNSHPSVSSTGITPNSATPIAPTIMPVITNGLVIQVTPHHNGEIHLSKIAVNQNPTFFDYPFTGMTVPKKAGNPTYPQRVPDPIVNIYVYDNTGALVNTATNYPLNTIYYTKKSEIRITITPSILRALNVAAITTNYPILVMTTSTILGLDYELSFYAPGSAVYNDYLSVCNQSLPSGGKPISRKMGWL